MTKLQVNCPLRTSEIVPCGTTPRIYVASTLSNWKSALGVCNHLEQQGITIPYRWCDWKEKTLEVAQEWKATIAEDELRGVQDAHCILALMPGERGTHFEMGAAYILHIPIVICDDTDGSARPVAFHKLPGVELFNNIQDSVDRAIEIAKARFLTESLDGQFLI